MKRILFLSLVAIAGFTFSASAQADSTAKRTPEEKLEAQMKHLKKTLNLSRTQEISVDSINKIFMVKVGGIRSNTTDRKAKAIAVKQANDDRTTAMKTILTADQYTKFEQMQEDQKEKIKERRAAGKTN
jgi:predicted small metal-binding protein